MCRNTARPWGARPGAGARAAFVLLAAGALLGACRPPEAAPPAQAQAPAITGQVATTAPPAAVELRVGDMAPDFALPDQNRQEVRLSQFRGQTVQVAFYVWALSPG